MDFIYRGIKVIHCEVTGRYFARSVLDDVHFDEEDIKDAIDRALDEV